MNTLPVKWEAMRRSLDEVVREAMEVDSRVKSMRPDDRLEEVWMERFEHRVDYQ